MPFACVARSASTGNAANNFVILRHIALSLIRLALAKRKGSLKVRRLIAATSDNYRAQLLGLELDPCCCSGSLIMQRTFAPTSTEVIDR